jgi:hypothetical protein
MTTNNNARAHGQRVPRKLTNPPTQKEIIAEMIKPRTFNDVFRQYVEERYGEDPPEYLQMDI